MLMAPARVDRVASFNAAAGRRRLRRGRARSSPALEKESLDVLRLTGADIERRTVRRLADMRYIGQGSEITVALPPPLTEAGVRAAFEAAYKALFARTPPGAAIQFVALRLSVSAPMPGTGGTLELPRHPSAQRAEGHAAGVLPRRRQDAADPGLGPLRARARRRTSTARRCSRKTKAPSSSAPARTARAAGRRLHPGGGRLMSRAHSIAIELELLWRRLISLVDEAAAAHGAHQLLDPGARELRLLLRRHRCDGPVAGAGDARASRASSARCPRR